MLPLMDGTFCKCRVMLASSIVEVYCIFADFLSTIFIYFLECDIKISVTVYLSLMLY